MRTLIHLCCGPCASGVVPELRERGMDVCGLFFNPNIHPLLEYRRRLTGAREAAERLDLVMIEDLTYDPEDWFRRVMAPSDPGSADSRCARCIAQRLDRTAAEAVRQGCRAFSTTLLISPWQDQVAIRSAGNRAAERHGVEFYGEDLRGLYPEARRRSTGWGLYRQKYCGCVVSEWERYRER